MFVARIGGRVVVFGLGTPLDHPPETNLMWVGGYTILYIYSIRWVVEWGHETKTSTFLTRSSRQKSLSVGVVR